MSTCSLIYSEDIWVHHYMLWFIVKTYEYMFSDLQWRHMSTCSLIYSEDIWVHALWFTVKTYEYITTCYDLQWRHMSTSLHVMIYSKDMRTCSLIYTPVKTYEYSTTCYDLQWRHMSTCSLIYSEDIWVHHYMLWFIVKTHEYMFSVKTYEYITTC